MLILHNRSAGSVLIGVYPIDIFFYYRVTSKYLLKLSNQNRVTVQHSIKTMIDVDWVQTLKIIPVSSNKDDDYIAPNTMFKTCSF